MRTLLTTILSVLLLTFAISAQAVQIPEYLIGSWSKASKNDETDVFKFAADGTFIQEITRQVGEEEGSIEYPTVCRYRGFGVVDSITPVSAETIADYQTHGKQAPSYDLDFRIDHVDLIDSKDNSGDCNEFIDLYNLTASEGGLHNVWTFSDLSENVLLDPWYVEVFIKD